MSSPFYTALCEVTCVKGLRCCNKLFDYGRHRGCDFTVKEYHLTITNGCLLLFYVKNLIDD